MVASPKLVFQGADSQVFGKQFQPAKEQDVMNDSPSREELDAKLESQGAQTDTKIARLEGKLDLVIAKLDYVMKDNSETRDTIRSEGQNSRVITWTVGVGILAVVVAAIALFPAIFDMGSKNQEGLNRAVREYFDSHLAPPKNQK